MKTWSVSRWAYAVIFMTSAHALYCADNFLLVRLPKNVTIELPRNWTVLSDRQRTTLDVAVQARRELSGAPFDRSSDLNFAANYYDETGKSAAIFNIRYYPKLAVDQSDARSIGAADLRELDGVLRSQISSTGQQYGMQVLAWMGTTKTILNGMTVFVTEYRRAGTRDGPPFRVRLVRVLNGDRSFTVTLSYREDQDWALRPICDRIISSLRA